MTRIALVAGLCAVVTLAGCQATGEQYRSDVYGVNQLNTAQQVQTVDIIAIQPARVVLNNGSNQDSSQIVGGVLGGILGAVIGHNVTGSRGTGTALGAIAGAALGSVAGGEATGGDSYVNGVQLTFKLNGRIFNSTQVGQMCEYKYGPAIMVSSTPTNTRIQPNNPYGCGAPQY